MKRIAIVVMALVLIVALGLVGAGPDVSACSSGPAAIADMSHSNVFLTAPSLSETILTPRAQLAGVIPMCDLLRAARVHGIALIRLPISQPIVRQVVLPRVRD